MLGHLLSAVKKGVKEQSKCLVCLNIGRVVPLSLGLGVQQELQCDDSILAYVKGLDAGV